jgi:hypothetical protein
MYGIQFLLQSNEVNNVVNILVYFMVKKAGARTRQPKGKCRGSQHWSDEECMIGRRNSREALKGFKDKNYKARRIKYWDSRKRYERTLENKKAAWQAKEAEQIDNLFRQN